MTTQTYAMIGVLAVALVLSMGVVSEAFAAPGGDGNGNGNGAQNGNGGNSGNNGNGNGNNGNGGNGEPACPENSQAPQCQDEEEEEEPPVEEPPVVTVQNATLTVVSQYEDGSELTGMWTTIRNAEGETIATGFTPMNFTLEVDADYFVTVANFKQIKFVQFSDGETSDLEWGAVKAISISEDTTVTAIYSKPVPKSSNFAIVNMAMPAFLELDGAIPESESGVSLYDTTNGPLGINLVTAMRLATMGGVEWSSLTEGQQVWLIENINALVEASGN